MSKSAKNKTSNPTCQDDYDPNSLDVVEAKRRIKQMLSVVSESETLAIKDALGRTVAKDVLSTINVPPYTNSAMDGYAIDGQDLGKIRTFLQVGVAYAGRPYNGTVKTGECIRIMTGAPICAGVDTVIMQEHITLAKTAEGESVTLREEQIANQKPGQNVRHQGEDLALGSPAILAGRRLTPSDIGLLASLGIAEIEVKRNVRVALLSTGDELKNIGETLEEGQIYDSNRHTIYCMLQRLGVDIIDLGIIKDKQSDIRAAFKQASKSADVIITSGGVSVGDADYVKQIMEEMGNINFWKIAMKPGRPLAVGQIGNAFFFGLPGNPVSAMVTFYQYIQPAVREIMGQTLIETPSVQMKCVSALKKRPGRVEFQRGTIFTNDKGEKVVKSTGNQGSHVLSSMSEANCFIILPMESGNVEKNTFVEVQPFEGLI